jgi:hypothetical protein
MSDGIYAAVNAMQPASEGPAANRVFAQAEPAQLRNRDNALLPTRRFGNRLVRCDDFPVHLTGKSSQPRARPLRWETSPQ